MKRALFLFLMLSFVTFCYAQKTVIDEVKDRLQDVTNPLTEDEKAVMFSFMEEEMVSIINSAEKEGRYIQALDLIDSLKITWLNLTGAPLPWLIYLTKASIQMKLEEWRGLIVTTDECLTIHKDDILDKGTAIMYDMQGLGYAQLENHREAIRSYENGIKYYTELGELGNQGDMFCRMAHCYASLEKYSIASSFYKKGLERYLSYFGTTRSALLRSDFYVKDPYIQTVLSVFASQLFSMAVFEQDYGSKSASKEYLLMSAHCGNETARSEYLRIYGR